MIRFRIPRVAALLLALAIILPAGARAPQDKPADTSPLKHIIGKRKVAKGIPNFGQVDDTLYRGGLPNKTGLEGLKDLGVNVVVDMRRGHDPVEEKTVTDLGMQYISIPSRCPYPQDEPIAKFLKVMEDNPDKRVFVHCRLGDDRTGIAVAAYRMAEQGWSADDAVKEMQTFGFSPLHVMICPGMINYAERFPERLKNAPAFRHLPSTKQESK